MVVAQFFSAGSAPTKENHFTCISAGGHHETRRITTLIGRVHTIKAQYPHRHFMLTYTTMEQSPSSTTNGRSAITKENLLLPWEKVSTSKLE